MGRTIRPKNLPELGQSECNNVLIESCIGKVESIVSRHYCYLR